MTHLKIIQKIEDSAHHFLLSLKTEAYESKEATSIVQKYIKHGKISEEEEKKLKLQMVDTLKILGIIIPLVLIPGASILMPLIIKVANKHNVNILPTSFRKKHVRKNNK